MRKTAVFFSLLITTIATKVQAQRMNFPDVLDLRTSVSKPRFIEPSVFSDMGAWHAYALPEKSTDYGSFIGPLVMDMDGKWLGNNFTRLQLSSNGKAIDLSAATISQHYYPGLLEQKLTVDGLTIRMQLIFISNRESMIRTSITNNDQARTLQPAYTGWAYNRCIELKAGGNLVQVAYTRLMQRFELRLPSKNEWAIQIADSSYTATGKSFTIAKGGTVTWDHTEAFYPSVKHTPSVAKPDFSKALKQNQQRWDGYLKRYFSFTKGLNADEKKLAVKAMVTLLTNWRSANKDLLHDGVFPSVNYQGFYGVWSWDSWKQAVGLSLISPSIARDNIRCMFDYIDSVGMVPDCIYSDRSENNLRDTKPALSAWGVWEVYKAAPDKKFLQEMYPMLAKYHRWWYIYRDHDKNGLCEFGSTDGTRIAAAWESGMDNAVRFDSAVMLKNGAGAWSLDQESIDLNAYLYKEKIYLAQIADVLNMADVAGQWRKEAFELKKYINEVFYDSKRGYYYDKRIGRTGHVTVNGPEGWIPLWAGICNQQQAGAVKDMMANSSTFNTLVPLPTLAADHPAFDPMKGYWRGPVWLDQFNYGIDGLKQYGYGMLAKELVQKLLKNAQGLLGNSPICENYHPLTGKGLNAKNFSWSSAHLLLLLKTK